MSDGFFNRRPESWLSPNLELPLELVAYGGFGKPLLVFSVAGDPLEAERCGLLEALHPYIAAGRIKLYSVATLDRHGWLNPSLSGAEKCRRHERFECAIVEEVVAFIRHDCRSASMRIAAAGAQLGAFHALTALGRFPERFDTAIGLSGIYDLHPLAPELPRAALAPLSPFGLLSGPEEAFALPLLRERSAIHLAAPRSDHGETTRLAAHLTRHDIAHTLELWDGDALWPAWIAQLTRIVAAHDDW